MANDGQHDYQYGDQGNIGRLPLGSFMGMEYDADGSYIAGEALAYGDPVFARPGAVDKVYLPHLNKAVTTFNADFVSLNSIATLINGGAVAAVVFATDHATTLAALAAAITADADMIALGISASVTGARELTIVSNQSIDLDVNFTVTLGASQATDTSVYSCNDRFLGIVMRATVSYENSADGVPSGYALSVATRGRFIVAAPAAETVLAQKPAYVGLDDSDALTYKMFSAVSTNKRDAGAWFAGNPVGGKVELDLRGIKG